MQTKSDRIPAAERRELILDAATQVFGELGYAGATTDRVARAAGISQPYVVRMFGTKEQLFIEVLERSTAQILATFDAEIAAYDAASPDDRTGYGQSLQARLGGAYTRLVQTHRGILLALMQGFLLGHDSGIGPVARECFMRVYDRLRDVMDAQGTMDFMAQGMLINTLIASGLTARVRTDSKVGELFECAFGDKAKLVVASVEGD
ncbi:TetR/AcrR family transcriptional regulator [Agromyces protaetiae]|uniref:TetR/AcrR family transcriptional regulator n=1 Tax=Agromyces protaetiae TaxID=2509455 RepID=UPI0013EE303B|nr:TetR/AcrR family transcriptional regulator [Agromyces protaetiae]